MRGSSHNEAVQDYMRKLARYLAPLMRMKSSAKSKAMCWK
jgi:hypothetical protein